MSKKAKCVKIELGVRYLTVGKVYDVVEIDYAGDVWIQDDVGDLYFMYPSECEVFEE